MATSGELINAALRTAGILATGETADSAMAIEALAKLNHLLESLSNENLAIYQNTQDSLTLDGSTSYTFGVSGTPDINSARPIKIHSAFYRDSNSLDYPVDVITQGEYDSIGDKTFASNILTYIYVNPTYPNATVYVYPVSSSGTLLINSTKLLTSFSTLVTSVSLPPGYERMIVYGLAAELMIEYGLINPAIEQRYIESKADLKRTNTNPAVMRVSVPFGRFRGNRHFESDGA